VTRRGNEDSLENRLQGLLNYLQHWITNAASEGMNLLAARIIIPPLVLGWYVLPLAVLVDPIGLFKGEIVDQSIKRNPHQYPPHIIP